MSSVVYIAKGRIANPRPVATINTGRVRMCLLLVARHDRS